MTGSLLRACLMTLAAIALAWLSYWWSHGEHAVAVVGAVAIMLAHVPVLAIEFVLMHVVNRRDPAPRARWSELISAWWAECRLGLQVFAWWMPFRANAQPDLLPSAAALADGSTQRGVVLVHGFMCNRGMWRGWQSWLTKEGVPHIAVTLEPTFGSIDDYVQTVDLAVIAMTQRTGMAPVIVAHSMGGLATRAWLRHRRELHAVHRVITLGTPHHGTQIGYLPLKNVGQMRLSSSWAQALAKDETPALRARFICFYSHCDNIVFPASSAMLPGADNRHVRAMAHMQLIEHPEVQAAVLASLRADDD